MEPSSNLRVYRERRYAIGERRRLRVAEHQLKSVAFLCTDEEVRPGVTARIPGGTAFFVVVEEDGLWHAYVITAAHNIEAAGRGLIYLRVNTEDSYDDILTRPEDWYVHDKADVALAPFAAERPRGYHLSAIGLGEFVTADYNVGAPEGSSVTYTGAVTGELTPTSLVPIRVGDEVVFIGLFVQHAGEKRNLPVVRFGHISRMPEEPVEFERAGGEVVESLAYLVESRSWGGHSGSPVYWTQPIIGLVQMDAPPPFVDHAVDGKIVVQNPDAHVRAFLGLVSGHFDIEQPATVIGDIQGSISTAINSGIAVVTPAEAVRGLLFREDVVEHRKRENEKAKSAKPKNTVTPNSATAPANQDLASSRYALCSPASVRVRTLLGPNTVG